MMKSSFYISIIVLLSSCSFNNIFLNPTPFPKDLKEYTIHTPDDTVKIYFSGVNHQPAFTRRNGIEPIEMDYTIESILFTSGHDDTLNGWFMKPKGRVADKTILHMHGNRGSLVGVSRMMIPFVKRGYQVFIFDYNGFGFSTGKPTRKNALTAGLAALEYVKSRPDVQNTKLVIYGQSFGGHLAAVVAAEREDAIDALVVEGAFSSPKDIGADRVPVLGRILVRQMYAATKSIRKYHKPLLVIHSRDDDVVPFKQGKKIYDLANPPKEFYEIKDCHICGPVFYPDEIAEKINGMIGK